MASKKYSPILYDYLKRYQEDPSSRVFAPLAEAYRKSGMVQEAVEIAREGLRLHPDFIGGKVALARALFDQQSYSEVIETLTQVVERVPDNLVAQRLFAESCLMTGRSAEALGAYKMLLYFSPDDREAAQIVTELEEQAYRDGALVLRTDPEPAAPDFQIRSVQGAVEADPHLQHAQWVRKIQTLQGLLQRVERYRARLSPT